MTRKTKAGRWIVLALVAALAVAALAVTAQAALHHNNGTVLSKESQGQRSFRISDDETGRKVRFAVTGRTEFERIPGGFSGLDRGLAVDVAAKRTDNGLVARKVEGNR